MKKLLLILVAFVCCLSLFTQDALLIYRQNYAKPLLVMLKDITNITYKDAEQVMSLEEWNITSESETTVIDSLVFVDLETLDTNEYAHFVCPDDHHPHMIDLGLPSGVLWSCCNVGASTPEGYGGYYAWGETEEKEVYGSSTYKYYNSDTYKNIHIGDDISGTEYDVAHMKWRGSWRMPTIDQINELLDNCKWTLTTLNGVYGSLVTGPNGATVFLPAAGSRDEEGLYGKGTDGYYWSSSLSSTGEKYSYALNFNSYEIEYFLSGRCDGCSVRPVVTPEKPKDDCPVAEAIDLGLPSGTRWASWNVGASAPEEAGCYYAWGETEEKDYYSEGTYKYYNSEINEYIHIGDDIAGTEYDVAHVKWGGLWRMPSLDQMTELLDNCTRTWTQQNGVNGTLVTGPNGNSIFLPAAGGRWLDDSGSEREYGVYWSSINQGGWGDFVYRLFFDSSSFDCSSGYCGYGQSVRPVCPSDNITFADEVVKAICVANWDTNGDGELSYGEAAAVKSVGKVFYEKQGISSFNELQYFTGLTIIEEEAFRQCSLESVSIPASVKTIGEKAFMQCPNLSNVTLTEGVTWIDEEAFSACSLTSIILPESLVRLGEQALEENPLISVTLPRNVAYLGNSDEDDLYGGVFDYCYSLKEVNVDESNNTYASIDGVLTTKDMRILLFFPYAKGEVCIVPEGIEQIHYDAFNESKITSVTLPSTLKSFYTDEDEENYSAFSNNFDLRTVRAKMKEPFECGYLSFSSETYSSGTLYVPIGTKARYETTAGWSGFQNIIEDENDCPVAEAIDLGLPSGTRWASWNVGASAPEEYGGYYAWGETEEKEYYDWTTYKYCNGSWNTMTKYFTDGYTKLLPEDDAATANWGAPWHMPTREQRDELIENCTIEGTQLNGVNGVLVTGPNGNTIFLPAAGIRENDDIKSEGSLGNCFSSSLDPGYPTGAEALYYFSIGFWYTSPNNRCYGLSVRPVFPPSPSTNIIFADATVKAICVANWDTNGDGELSYGEAAAVKSVGKVFYEKQGISSFNELQYFTGLTIIEEEAFRECSLESVSIPASVKTIGEKAFMQCPNLSNVTLPEGVTWIDEEAFSACALTSIILPESLVRLGKQALEENPLISVTLPRNVAYLGNSDEDDLYGGVFDYCYSLKDVNVVESNETYASIKGVLTTKDKKLFLFFPYAKAEVYTVPEGIEQIHYDAFNECKITSVTLPSTLKSFYTDEDEESYSAFSNNFDLRTVRAKMKVPFECGYYSFSSETYSSGTLHVPQGTKALYETTTGWSRFQNIVDDLSDCPVAEAIDLGLPSGTKWASWNIGASKPEEYGGYYAWGETEEKDYYDWSTYKYCNGSDRTMTKYCDHSDYGDNGFTDGLTELLPEDDAATANWGAPWHMPTIEQYKELKDNCTCEWTQSDGVNGILVTGPNGNTIFLPAAGIRWRNDPTDFLFGHYWSSSLFPVADGATYTLFSSYSISVGGYLARFAGLSVRAVCP